MPLPYRNLCKLESALPITKLRLIFQVLDVSFNRIRDLNKHSFARYHDIKYLYLFENMIQNVEPDTFSHLNELEAIDLATNALTTIPLELFDLPLLRNIYLNSNALGNSIEDTKNEIKVRFHYISKTKGSI